MDRYTVSEQDKAQFAEFAAQEVERARRLWAERMNNPNHDDQHKVQDWCYFALRYADKAADTEDVDDIQKAAAMLFEAWWRSIPGQGKYAPSSQQKGDGGL